MQFFWHQKETFLLFEVSRLDLGPTHPHIQWYWWLFTSG